jgi:hypothetical protein
VDDIDALLDDLNQEEPTGEPPSDNPDELPEELPSAADFAEALRELRSALVRQKNE